MGETIFERFRSSVTVWSVIGCVLRKSDPRRTRLHVRRQQCGGCKRTSPVGPMVKALDFDNDHQAIAGSNPAWGTTFLSPPTLISPFWKYSISYLILEVLLDCVPQIIESFLCKMLVTIFFFLTCIRFKTVHKRENENDTILK